VTGQLLGSKTKVAAVSTYWWAELQASKVATAFSSDIVEEAQ
jgi:hypothetical protein